MRWNAVLLDLYDTLVWTEWSGLRDLFAERLGVDRATLLRAFEVTRPARSVGAYADAAGEVAAVLAELDIHDEATVADVARIQHEFFASAERVHLHDDSIPTVRTLRARGARTAIVSNCSHPTRAEVRALGLEDEFDAIVLSFEVKAMKPEPAIYAAALEAVGAAAADAVFVDDQAAYCDGARDLGIDTRLIVRPWAAPAEGFAPDTNGHLVIEDLTALLD
jgi:putative hydrolase of the HAD superfamily